MNHSDIRELRDSFRGGCTVCYYRGYYYYNTGPPKAYTP
jgi:hypothetical protein